MITFFIIILVLSAVIGILWALNRQDELDEREEELDKMSVHLDERANRIAAEEEIIKNEWKYIRMAKDMLDKQQKEEPKRNNQ